MGFEVTFLYFEKDESEEDFNKDEENIKTRTINIGSPDELVPMEKVAATIIKEYTKQNIWVEDVQVQEWVRKNIKCTQTKTGVRIGSKSFNLGLNEIMKWAVDDAPKPQPQPQPTQQVVQQPQPTQQVVQQPVQQVTNDDEKVWPHEANQPKRTPQQQTTNSNPGSGGKVSNSGLQYAQRVEVCDPPPELKNDIPKFRLTLGKKYKIIEEKIVSNERAVGGMDVMYLLQNDEGREVMISCHYFRQPHTILEEEAYYDPNSNMWHNNTSYVDQGALSSKNNNQPRLLYEDAPRGMTPPPQQQLPQQRLPQQQLPQQMIQEQAGGQSIDEVMAKMDAAVKRRMTR